MGPAWFRRILLDMLPHKKIQRLKYITDTVHAKSQEIFYAKRAAIERGDQELLHAVGEGKDIMSILRECLHPSPRAPAPPGTVPWLRTCEADVVPGTL